MHHSINRHPLHENLSPLTAPMPTTQKSASSSIKSPLPYTTSNVDDFMQTTNPPQLLRERKVSSSSDDNLDYEPYSRRDFRMDFKSSDKTVTSLNDTPTSGYFTSPSEMKEMNVFSPESSDYERFDHQKQIIKKRDEYSSSPVDSQRSTSSLCRKSVSFDLDVEEYTPPYNQHDSDYEHYDENAFYEKSRFHQHQQQQPKRIKGILRAASPNVYYHPQAAAAYTQNRSTTATTMVEKEFIEIEDDEIEKENPFRKEYLSQEKLNTYEDDQQTLLAIQSVVVASDLDQSEMRNPFVQSGLSSSGSTEYLNKIQTSKIPIKKTIFKATGNLVDKPLIAERPKLPPPPPSRPPKPQVKVAEMVKNEGLERMSQHMEEDDFMEFVHDVKTNTIQEVKSHSKETFNPENSPLPPIPKNPPPPLNLKRINSRDRPKDSPPAPPTPIAITPTSEILEILPAKYDNFPRKQTPHFVNENSQSNILVTELEHREILLTENELRNAILSEYDENSSLDNNSEKLLNFSSTNPFLESSSSYGSSPNLLSPVSTLDNKSQGSSSTMSQYTPVYRDTINILPPHTQVLPVHYGQLPKPQHANYPTIHSHQLPSIHHYNPTGFPTFQQSSPHQFVYQQHQHQRVTPELIASEQNKAYLVSGDGQNSFYVTHTHNVNNTTPPNNNQQQTLLMQSAYMPLQQLPSPSIQHQQIHLQVSTPQNNNQPQFAYEHQNQQQNLQQLYNFDSLRSAQYVHEKTYLDSISELSPIRVNQVSHNNFMFASETTNEQQQKKSSMSSFGKNTEV